jgi:hypothetical protein
LKRERNCLLQESIFDTVDSLLSRHRELEVSLGWIALPLISVFFPSKIPIIRQSKHCLSFGVIQMQRMDLSF